MILSRSYPPGSVTMLYVNTARAFVQSQLAGAPAVKAAAILLTLLLAG
jgi:hypothetical protein